MTEAADILRAEATVLDELAGKGGRLVLGRGHSDAWPRNMAMKGLVTYTPLDPPEDPRGRAELAITPAGRAAREAYHAAAERRRAALRLAAATVFAPPPRRRGRG